MKYIKNHQMKRRLTLVLEDWSPPTEVRIRPPTMEDTRKIQGMVKGTLHKFWVGIVFLHHVRQIVTNGAGTPRAPRLRLMPGSSASTSKKRAEFGKGNTDKKGSPNNA